MVTTDFEQVRNEKKKKKKKKGLIMNRYNSSDVGRSMLSCRLEDRASFRAVSRSNIFVVCSCVYIESKARGQKEELDAGSGGQVVIDSSKNINVSIPPGSG